MGGKVGFWGVEVEVALWRCSNSEDPEFPVDGREDFVDFLGIKT